MAKQVISPEEFIVEVNKRLPEHHAYKPGWRIFFYPEGSDATTAKGFDVKPRRDIGHITQVITLVLSQYTVSPLISRVERAH